MKTKFSPDSVQEPKPQPKLVKLVTALRNYINGKPKLAEVVSKNLITFENNLAQEKKLDRNLVRLILFYFCWPWHVFIGSTPPEGLKEYFEVDSFEEIKFESLVERIKLPIENFFINPDEIKSLNLQIFEVVIRAIIEHEGRILNKKISTLIKEVFGEEFLNRVLNSITNQIN
jgi:hypothetical protein